MFHKPIITFGKHKDKYAEDVPIGYLGWCLEKAEGLDPEMLSDIEYELAKRAKK